MAGSMIWRLFRISQPNSSLNPKPETLKPEIRNPKPEPETRNPKPETPKPECLLSSLTPKAATLKQVSAFDNSMNEL